jgi:hypothetical protein
LQPARITIIWISNAQAGNSTRAEHACNNTLHPTKVTQIAAKVQHTASQNTLLLQQLAQYICIYNLKDPKRTKFAVKLPDMRHSWCLSVSSLHTLCLPFIKAPRSAQAIELTACSHSKSDFLIP